MEEALPIQASGRAGARLSTMLFAATLLSVVTLGLPVHGGTSFGVNRIRTVAATGTPEQNCQSLRDVLSSIDDNSWDNRYLLQLEPADYDCGTTSVILGDGIALVGSGVHHTRIVGEVDSPVLGVVHINGDRVQIRSLTVINLGDDPTFNAIGISIQPVFSNAGLNQIELRDVSVSGVTYSIYSDRAIYRVWSSQLIGTLRHDSSGASGGLATIYFSVISNVVGTGSTSCYSVSLSNGSTLDPSCQPTP